MQSRILGARGDELTGNQINCAIESLGNVTPDVARRTKWLGYVARRKRKALARKAEGKWVFIRHRLK